MVRRPKNALEIDLSPAEEALLAKFKTIKHHKALADLKRKNSLGPDDSNTKKDARERAIDIIRARRARAEPPSQEDAKPKPKLKIKLATTKPASKPVKRKNNLIVDSDEEDSADDTPKTKNTTETPSAAAEGASLDQKGSNKDQAAANTTKPPAEKKRHVVNVKRRAQSHISQKPPESQRSTLFVDQLPEFFGRDELLQYFGVGCQLQVTGIFVFEGCSSAIVTFGTVEDANMVLSHAPSMVLGDQPLSVRWATDEDIQASEKVAQGGQEMGTGPSDPRMARVTGALGSSDAADDYYGNDRDDLMEDNPDEEEDNDPRSRNVVDYFDL